jgi:hypothetical protein
LKKQKKTEKACFFATKGQREKTRKQENEKARKQESRKAKKQKGKRTKGQRKDPFLGLLSPRKRFFLKTQL